MSGHRGAVGIWRKAWCMAGRSPCVAWPIAWGLPPSMSKKAGICESASCHGGSGSRQALQTCETYPRTVTSDLGSQARKCGPVTPGHGFGGCRLQPSFSKWRINRRSTCNVRMTPACRTRKFVRLYVSQQHPGGYPTQGLRNYSRPASSSPHKAPALSQCARKRISALYMALRSSSGNARMAAAWLARAKGMTCACRASPCSVT